MEKMGKLKSTAMIWAFGLAKIPMIAWLMPTVEERSATRTVLRIPLTWRSRNHLKSMYFGALCVGADVAAGLVAMDEITKSGKRIDFVFKDINGRFLKRADGDTHFTCTAGDRVKELVAKAVAEPLRFEERVEVVATVPANYGDTPVAVFELTMSLKARPSK